jgi:hypothetical protein
MSRGLSPQLGRQLIAKAVDAMFEALIEHISNHDHPALRPLTHAAELGMMKLGLPAVPRYERGEHRERRVEADPVSLRDFGNDAKPVRRQILHGGFIPD